jgi:hypothetical protein
VVEGTGLENRHTGEPGIVSSNLTLSAVHRFNRRRGGHEPIAPVFRCNHRRLSPA